MGTSKHISELIYKCIDFVDVIQQVECNGRHCLLGTHFINNHHFGMNMRR